ncbi:MAG: ATP-binding domain-containing protein, partial [Bacteroidales bacterium]|nr:ATP-binding domain-containing protein [Bacteroidales bacterium]
MLSYFRLVINPLDNEAFRRIINVPARGIGATTVSHLSAISAAEGISMLDAVLLDEEKLRGYDLKSAAISKLRQFASQVFEYNDRVARADAYRMALEIGNNFGILNALRADQSIEGITKLENVEELYNSIKEYCEEQKELRIELGEGTDEEIVVTLSEYLENITLLSAVEREEDSVDDDSDNKITMMTLHASKGLEFPYVYIIGMEENLFPSANDISAKDIEEERRLFYVGMTRAMKAICLSHAENRMKWGKSESNAISRFVREIDPKYIDGAIPQGREPLRMSGEDLKRAFISTPRTSYSGIRTEPRQTVPQRIAPVRSSSSTFVPSPIGDLKVGQRIEHDRFGYGAILAFDGDGADKKAIVEFDDSGRKTLLLKYAKLRIA